MLASLLPGLRDVRVPLTVGYLWLLVAWSLFGGHFPDKPSGESDGPIARLYELSGFLGDAAAIASVSFAAYVVGALLTLPLEGSVGRYLLRVRAEINFRWGRFRNPTPLSRIFPEVVPIAREYKAYEDYLLGVEDQLRQVLEGHGLTEITESQAEQVDAALNAYPEDLRPRLLSAEHGKEIYGEYDRLAAEAAFRINIALPLVALGSVVVGYLWAGRLSTFEALALTVVIMIVTVLVAAVLIVQGVNRLHASVVTIQRAAIIGVFVHPIQELAHRVSEGAWAGA